MLHDSQSCLVAVASYAGPEKITASCWSHAAPLPHDSTSNHEPPSTLNLNQPQSTSNQSEQPLTKLNQTEPTFSNQPTSTDLSLSDLSRITVIPTWWAPRSRRRNTCPWTLRRNPIWTRHWGLGSEEGEHGETISRSSQFSVGVQQLWFHTSSTVMTGVISPEIIAMMVRRIHCSIHCFKSFRDRKSVV